jgi:hypothetical protein
MRRPGQSILAGIAAGTVLAVGGVMAADALTGTADAQSSNQVTQADLDAANLRSQRAIKQATEAWNKVAKYLAEPGELIRANGPRVSQEAGVGGGLPTGLFADAAITTPKIADGAVTESKLAEEVTNRLPLWAHVSSAGALVRGRGATGATKTGVGGYRVAFSRDVSACGYTATQFEAVGPVGVGPALGAPTEVFVVTQTSGGGGADRAFMIQVTC